MQSLSKFRTPNTNKAMGIEIECIVRTRDEERNLIACPIEGRHYGFFYATNDGSIDVPWGSRDIVGREMVSQPLSAEWLKKEINKLAKRFSWEENESCGVHIHVSRKWLSREKAKLIYSFMQSLTEAQRVELFGRDASGGFCGVQFPYGTSRYSAMNDDNKATIEFRVFKSGDAKWCCYCVDMVQYLIENARQLNIDAILAFRDSYEGLV